jgi:hypothetical protein
MSARVVRIVTADRPEDWERAGFALSDSGSLDVAGVEIVPGGAGHGFVRWELSGIATEALDGLATSICEGGAEERAPAPEHPNGVISLDHVVAFSPDLDRTIEALRGAGLDLRRVREQPTPAGAPRQAFFRLGAVILEVVQQRSDAPGFDPAKPARLWGLAFNCSDLDALAARLGDLVKGPREAVQPGRRIATLARAAGLAVPVAFMSPAPERGTGPVGDAGGPVSGAT